MVAPDIKTAKDLKGKKLSAVGGGVGGFNWLMGRQVLESAGLTVDDVQFIAGATAGRVPGLLTGQIDGVALHPEDVYLAQQKNPKVHVLVQLSDLLPNYFYNAYGAQIDWIANATTPLMVDAVAAMIEAHRTVYRDEAKVVPDHHEGDRQAERSGRICLEGADRALRLVGEPGLRRQAHAMDHR